MSNDKAKSPFDHVTAIYSDQSLDYFDKLSDRDKKAFSTFMTNRILSMNPALVTLVNEFQQYSAELKGRETYLFYSQIVPKKKQYHKYVKANAESEYAEWLINLVARYYQVSKSQAEDYLKVFYLTDEGKAELRSICVKYATDEKLLKKVKL